MGTERIILCGGLGCDRVQSGDRSVLALNLWKKVGPANVTLRIEDIHDRLWKNVPGHFQDLLEIAAYVYAADAATKRGGIDVDTFGESWRRGFEFHVPVRDPDRWNSPDVKGCLCDVLGYLSDDHYEFVFHPAKDAPKVQGYLELTGGEEQRGQPTQVMLFSGGLDSLAGAIDELLVGRQRVMLVNHRSTPKHTRRYEELRRLLGEKAGALRPGHVAVRIHKEKELGKDYTQRSRSFLYVALGATVAQTLGLRNVRFYENGVVSMNLPVCAQVVGGRATRTTHPKVLRGFQSLISLVAGEQYLVENPFLWKTKGDVVKNIVEADCGALITQSRSCAHTWQTSTAQAHCGVCSQCIDRRFGVIAAGAEAFDPVDHYKVDIFTKSRPRDDDKIMGAMYVERANQVGQIKEVWQLLAKYPGLTDVVGALEDRPAQGAQRVLDLYRRHAAEVGGAMDKKLTEHAPELRRRTLPPDCLLRTAMESDMPVTMATAGAVEPATAPRGGRNGEKAGPRYVLRMGLHAWELVFDGERDLIMDGRAIQLVENLLKDPPGEAIHASVWENRVDGSPLIDGFRGIGRAEDEERAPVAVGEVGGVIEERAGKKFVGTNTLPALKAKLAELTADIENEDLPEIQREEARQERMELIRAQQRGGKLVGGAEKAVDRVRKQVRTLIDELRGTQATKGKPNEVLQAFGKHLDDYLWLPSMGRGGGRRGAGGRPGCFIYMPPAGVVWKD